MPGGQFHMLEDGISRSQTIRAHFSADVQVVNHIGCSEQAGQMWFGIDFADIQELRPRAA